jgi:hypothetical protein
MQEKKPQECFAIAALQQLLKQPPECGINYFNASSIAVFAII